MKPVSAQKLALFSKLWNAMATMAAIKDSPTTTAALWQHHILAALPPRDSEEYEYSKLMQDVAIGIHALTAAGKMKTNVSTFATLFQFAAQKLREREAVCKETERERKLQTLHLVLSRCKGFPAVACRLSKCEATTVQPWICQFRFSSQRRAPHAHSASFFAAHAA